jgi:hypothetical protein
MRTRILLSILLALPTLAACSAPETTVSAYTADTPTDPALTEREQTCSDLSTTGDMYRYCMEVGPQQAIIAPESRSHDIAAVR